MEGNCTDEKTFLFHIIAIVGYHVQQSSAHFNPHYLLNGIRNNMKVVEQLELMLTLMFSNLFQFI